MESKVRRFRGIASLLLAFGALALASACGSSPPSRFYLLTPLPDDSGEAGAREGDDALTIRLDPVELPRYLNVPEIVTRVGGNELELAEYDRWGESLQDNFGRVLSQNVSVLIGSARVARYVWELPGAADYHVGVAVLRFDAEDGAAILDARWSLARGRPKQTILARSSRHVRPVSGEGYRATAVAMSATVADLSREIVAAIREAQAQPAP